MAKGQSRGNREPKKPKATKVKAAAAPSPAGKLPPLRTARAGFEGPAVNNDPVNLDEHRGWRLGEILRSAAIFAMFRPTRRHCEIARKN